MTKIHNYVLQKGLLISNKNGHCWKGVKFNCVWRIWWINHPTLINHIKPAIQNFMHAQCIYSKALRYTIFETTKNICSKFVKLELLNWDRAKSSKNHHAALGFSLHKSVYLKLFWTQLEKVPLQGWCCLRLCSSRLYCTHVREMVRLSSLVKLSSWALVQLSSQNKKHWLIVFSVNEALADCLL